jgi:hypothetical protein
MSSPPEPPVIVLDVAVDPRSEKPSLIAFSVAKS